MKFDTRSKYCKRVSSSHECYVLTNKAIPASSMMDSDRDNEAVPQSPKQPLGRQVAYEPYLFHSPILASERIRSQGGSSGRVSKKYMQKLNDAVENAEIDDLSAADELVDALQALAISSQSETPRCKLETRGDDGVPAAAVSSSSTDSSDQESEGSAEATKTKKKKTFGKIKANVREIPVMGRVQVKVIDEVTRQEVLVSRCVRFLDTEEAEI
jgi:hypothetical protein